MESPLQALHEAIEADPLFGEVRRAASRPAEAYVCGAYILEGLTGREPGGLLVATAGDPGRLAEALARATGRAVVNPGGREGVFSLPGKGGRSLTVVPLDRDIRTHLRGCDFTARAMAVDVFDGPPRHLIDPFGGQADIDSRILRAVTRRAFSDDPARLLSAVGLFAEYGLVPDEGTLSLMRSAAPLAGRIEPFRAWKLLACLFGGRGLSSGARLLERSGVLAGLLPEVAATLDVPQNYYHHLGVWEHTLETLDRLEELIEDPARCFRAFDSRIRGHLRRELEGGVTRRAYLGFAALVHDVGKPGTMSVEPSGRIRFQGHQRRGALLAGGIAGRLGLRRRGAAHLEGIVADHMRLGFLLEEGETAEARLRAVRALGRRCIEVVLLSLADRMATRGEASTDETMARYARLATRVMHDCFWDMDYPPLVSGDDIVLFTGIEPGPEVGRALFRVRVAQRESLVSSRIQALEYTIGAG